MELPKISACYVFSLKFLVLTNILYEDNNNNSVLDEDQNANSIAVAQNIAHRFSFVSIGKLGFQLCFQSKYMYLRYRIVPSNCLLNKIEHLACGSSLTKWAIPSSGPKLYYFTTIGNSLSKAVHYLFFRWPVDHRYVDTASCMFANLC